MDINMTALNHALGIMGKGMFGIFVVLVVLSLIVWSLAVIDKKISKSEEK